MTTTDRAVPDRRQRPGDWFERAAAVVLVGAIGLAPWLVTPLRTASARGLAVVLVTGCACWGLALAIGGRTPVVPRWLLVLVAAVIVDAGLMLALDRWNQRRVSVDVLVTVVPVLLAGVALTDLARRTIIRDALLWTLTTSGSVLALVGTAHRLGADAVSFTHDPAFGGTPFASFGYHGNAASFLLLALVAALLLDGLAHRRRERRAGDRIARWCAVIIAAGIAANVSKAGLVGAVVVVVSWVVLTWSGPARLRARTAVVAGGIVLVVVGVVGAWARWLEVRGAVSTDSGRWLTWRVALHAWGRSPLLGGGPGTFKVALPEIVEHEVPQLYRRWIVQPYVRGRPVSTWMYADNDGLQVLAEWGIVGGALLSAIVLGTLTAAVIGARSSAGEQRLVLLAGVLALGAIVAHSLVDFPLHVASIQLAAVAWGAIVLGSPSRGAAVG